MVRPPFQKRVEWLFEQIITAKAALRWVALACILFTIPDRVEELYINI